MYSHLTTLCALASLGAAAPVLEARQSNSWSAASPSSSAAASSSTGGGQLKSGNPFSYPLDNGFPNLSDAAKAQVNVLAQGIEPNSPAPHLDANSLLSFQLIAFNEIWEVAFFTSLLYNVTNDIEGFAVADAHEKAYLVKTITAIQAQEELHADAANTFLKANGVAPIEGCQYKFPTATLADAFKLATLFTDVVVGTLQDVQLGLTKSAVAGAQVADVVRIIGGVIGNEAEQTGFFRSYNGLIPSAKPFLTRAAGVFAANALNQNFVVPGSCPAADNIKVPTLEVLTLMTNPVAAQDQTLTFSVMESVAAAGSTVNVALINGQQVPVVQQATVTTANGMSTFSVNFPYTEFQMDGLTIAALTSAGDLNGAAFTSAEDVAQVAIAGPALIEVN